MKIFSIVFLTGLMVAWTPLDAAEQSQTFAIEKMTCAACTITVKKAMENVAGVTSVTVDFETKTATATFDDDASTADEIAQASTNAGYLAKAIE